MALNVETGTGSPTSESYETIENAAAYAAARGLSFSISGAPAIALAEQAMRRATTWLDGAYRGRFSGWRKNRREQALEWPRSGASDQDCNAIADDEIPVEIKHATIEAAVRELAKPGSLSPDVTPGKIKKSVAISGAVAVEYAVGAADVQDQRPVMTVVDGILAPLLGSRASSIVGETVRR